MYKFFLAFAFLAVFKSISPVFATISLEERIKQADLVIEGKVSDSYSFWDTDNKNIYTSYRVKISRVLKGPSVSEFEVIIKGGIIGNIMQQVSSSIEFYKEDRGYFILKNLDPEDGIINNIQGKYSLFGSIHGFFKLEGNEEINSNNLPTTDKKISEFLESLSGQRSSRPNIEQLRLKSSISKHAITRISPKSLTAGTGSLLSISGNGFGNIKADGQVWFTLADNTEYIFSNAGFDFKTWSDTLIQIIVPDAAATGNVMVKIANEDAISLDILTIRYAHMNSNYITTVLVDADKTGGYTWHYNTNLNSNVLARNIMQKSIERWVCTTKIPWQVGDITGASPGMDGICTISFGKIIDSKDGTLGQANTFYLGVVKNSKITDWILKEVDIVFSNEVDWCFNRSAILSTQMDFESVALHELAHAHLIGHVNDNNDLMHYGIELGNFRDINPTNIDCGNYIIDKSLNFADPVYGKIKLSPNFLAETPEKISGNSIVVTGQNYVNYAVPSITNATSYIWALPTGASGTSMTNSIIVNYGLSAVSGNISVKGHNSCGDGVASTLDITVNAKPSTPAITQNGDFLHSNTGNGNQWYNQNGLIIGATSQDYYPETNGNYYVVVSVAAKSSEPSNSINFISTGIVLIETAKSVIVYPNPVTNELILEIKGNSKESDFEILNSIGQIVYTGILNEKTIVQTTSFSSGIYLIKFKSRDHFEFKKVLKN
jgi:hypothetical protein